MICVLNFVSCFELHLYSTFTFYKNNFYQPSFFIFCKVLFSFMMHLFNYIYKTLKPSNKNMFAKGITLQKIFNEKLKNLT